MAEYCIVAARPKNASNHANSSFKLYELDAAADSWKSIGWKSISEVCGLMKAGHELCTGKIAGGNMNSGAAVELELRIAKNGTVYKIGDMPDT